MGRPNSVHYRDMVLNRQLDDFSEESTEVKNNKDKIVVKDEVVVKDVEDL